MVLMNVRGWLLAWALLLVFTPIASAQQLPPLPPPPVSLTVPHPIPPVAAPPLPPSDLYRRVTPPHSRRGPIVPPGYVYGPSAYGAYEYRLPGSDYMFPGYEPLGPLPVP